MKKEKSQLRDYQVFYKEHQLTVPTTWGRDPVLIRDCCDTNKALALARAAITLRRLPSPEEKAYAKGYKKGEANRVMGRKPSKILRKAPEGIGHEYRHWYRGYDDGYNGRPEQP